MWDIYFSIRMSLSYASKQFNYFYIFVLKHAHQLSSSLPNSIIKDIGVYNWQGLRTLKTLRIFGISHNNDLKSQSKISPMDVFTGNPFEQRGLFPQFQIWTVQVQHLVMLFFHFGFGHKPPPLTSAAWSINNCPWCVCEILVSRSY